MKKMKLILLAALLLGVGSAFTTVKPMNLAQVWASDDHGENFFLVNTEDEGDLYSCETGDEYCTYSAPNISSGIGPKTRLYTAPPPAKK